ncbi:hypothetical protein GJ744_006559 [Endocarpon pusillum]|uniref:Uncharacterized protein n=1 Tax=Endocarpon pusillum TaxID=364733 RepID=A0A8H7AR42_9EURO|nr:hypothetical protein GJ744_006559 [Endocarpon pusillum]
MSHLAPPDAQTDDVALPLNPPKNRVNPQSNASATALQKKAYLHFRRQPLVSIAMPGRESLPHLVWLLARATRRRWREWDACNAQQIDGLATGTTPATPGMAKKKPGSIMITATPTSHQFDTQTSE